MTQETNITRGHVDAANSITAAQGGPTALLEVIVEDVASLGIDIAVSDFDLDQFVIQGRMSRDSAYQTMYSASADFASPEGAVIDASGDLTAQAAGTSGWLMLNVLALYSVKILASSSNAAGSPVVIRAIGKG